MRRPRVPVSSAPGRCSPGFSFSECSRSRSSPACCSLGRGGGAPPTGSPRWGLVATTVIASVVAAPHVARHERWRRQAGGPTVRIGHGPCDPDHHRADVGRGTEPALASRSARCGAGRADGAAGTSRPATPSSRMTDAPIAAGRSSAVVDTLEDIRTGRQPASVLRLHGIPDAARNGT
jgi:hypothetical protein